MSFDYKTLLGYQRKKTLKFSEFVDAFVARPGDYMHTAASLISEAIKYFGFEIVIRSGEPVISYNIFKDLFSNGINAVFGQEFCIKYVMDVVESAEKEAGPNRGIVLVGPPASGKTNIVDLVTRAVEEYTKQSTIHLYSFFFQFQNGDRLVELRSAFRHSPLLLFPISLQREDGTVSQPRQELFDYINKDRAEYEKIPVPTYYQNAALDKRTLDILEALLQNPRNKEKSLFAILEETVRVEEIEFSNAQAKGIANIDELQQLKVRIRPSDLGDMDSAILTEHLPGKSFFQYEGAMIDSNRGILHIHDSFGAGGDGVRENDYKPLLMLLGSGKTSIESTQAPLDNTVIMTTNLKEMDLLEQQLTSSKLLDRIEKVPVNYLLDANSEMDILKRDMSNIREKYDFDPNLLRVAAYYSVMTRLLPPVMKRKKLPADWSDAKCDLFYSITPEQKLFIYASQAEDPIATIQKLPHWHPFRNESMRLGLNLYDIDSFTPYIKQHPSAVNLRSSDLFTDEQLRLIDDEFMRELWNEHYPNEGKHGISIRQLQNIMRNTIANSDGRKIHVGIFLSQLKRLMSEGTELHHWLATEPQEMPRQPIPARRIGNVFLEEGVGGFGDFDGLVPVVKAIYYTIIRKEITLCTVDRDPERIEADLRRYLQHSLLARAVHNKAFSHVMVPRYTFIDPVNGVKVDEPDVNYMESIEKILCHGTSYQLFREEIAQKFLDLQSTGELLLEPGKSIITSKNDSVVTCFAKEYNLLLSHRKVDDSINPELLRNAFFHKRNDPDQYEHHTPEIRDFVERIINNMIERFRYSGEIALNTIVFALRKEIVDFEKILS